MSLLRQATTSSGWMALSMATISLCRFVRNVVLARMLMPADFGIGATFAIVLTFLELITEFSPAKQLVQAKEGDREDWQGVCHTMLVVRGICTSAILFLAAGPIAASMGAPETMFAFRCLAIVPLLRGLVHCDVFRFQREIRLGRLSFAEAAPEVVSLACAPLAGWFFGDYRAFLVLVLISAGGRSLFSHLVAVRPYQVHFNREISKQFLTFGWPLVANGVLLFLILHGERVLVVTYFDLATLGAYSVALALGFTPAMLVARLHGSVALPIFSRTQENPTAFARSMASSSQLMCLAGGLMAILFLVAGPWMVGVLYGEKYLIASQVVPWIGLMCAMRMVRATTAIASMGLGDTKISLIANLARAASFAASAWCASRGFDLVWIPICGFYGELAAYSISLVLLKVKHGAPVEINLTCFATMAACVAGVSTAARVGIASQVLPTPLAAGGGLVALLAVALVSWKELRRLLQTLLAAPGGLTR